MCKGACLSSKKYNEYDVNKPYNIDLTWKEFLSETQSKWLENWLAKVFYTDQNSTITVKLNNKIVLLLFSPIVKAPIKPRYDKVRFMAK